MTATSQPPTPQEKFIEATSLALTMLIADAVVSFYPAFLSHYNARWFQNHCDFRIRYLHANDEQWKKWLESRDPTIDPRDQIGVWVKHWFQAFNNDPIGYRLRYPHNAFYA